MRLKEFAHSSAAAEAPKLSLAKYRLTPDLYREINETLEQFGYNDAQKDKIILRRRCKAIFRTLSELHEELSTLGYNHQQLTSIAAHDGGSRNLTAVKEHHETLIDLGFSVDQIVSISRREQGKKNLEAVRKNHDALQELGFTADEIVRVITGENGRKQLVAEIAKRQPVHQESDAVSIQELPDVFMGDVQAPLPLQITIAAYNNIVIEEHDSPSHDSPSHAEAAGHTQRIQTRRAAAESKRRATNHAERVGKRQETSLHTYSSDALPRSDAITPLREWAIEIMPLSPLSSPDSSRPQSLWSQRSASPAGSLGSVEK